MHNIVTSPRTDPSIAPAVERSVMALTKFAVVDSTRCASTDRCLALLLLPASPCCCCCCCYTLYVRYAAADFFQNISGDPTNTASVFLTSTYGPLADQWQSNSGLYNYALFFIGSQPAGAGTPFLPQEALTTAVDWSPFSPHAATPGGLDVATGWGPTQYGCCPKTVADPPTLPVRCSRTNSLFIYQ